MLQSISWLQYFSSILILLFIYYSIIGVRYFKWEILNVLGIKRIETGLYNTYPVSDFKNEVVNNLNDNNTPASPSELNALSAFKSFNDEVRAFLNGTNYSETNKQELSGTIKKIFSNYPSLYESDFSTEMKTVLLDEINQHYPNLLELQDLNNICT